MNDPLAPLLAGAFVIVCGLLVKRFPMLISGYNTLPKEKRKNVDIDGLSSFMRRHLVIIGGLLILFTTILELTGQQEAFFHNPRCLPAGLRDLDGGPGTALRPQ